MSLAYRQKSMDTVVRVQYALASRDNKSKAPPLFHDLKPRLPLHLVDALVQDKRHADYVFDSSPTTACATVRV